MAIADLRKDRGRCRNRHDRRKSAFFLSLDQLTLVLGPGCTQIRGTNAELQQTRAELQQTRAELLTEIHGSNEALRGEIRATNVHLEALERVTIESIADLRIEMRQGFASVTSRIDGIRDIAGERWRNHETRITRLERAGGRKSDNEEEDDPEDDD